MRALWLIGLWAFCGAASAAAGSVTLLTGKATALTPDGTVRNLSKGSQVESGEVISSGAGTYVNLKFADGGLILLRPNTRFQIERYAYEPKPAPKAATGQTAKPSPSAGTQPRARPSAFFRLLKGGLRTVTGLIGKVNHNDYRLATPTATIGIRGTEVFAYTCHAGCSNDAAVLAALKDVFGDKNFSFDKSDIIGTLEGEVNVKNTTTGENSPLTKGKFTISTTTQEGNVPLDDPGSNLGGGGDLLQLDPKNCK